MLGEEVWGDPSLGVSRSVDAIVDLSAGLRSRPEDLQYGGPSRLNPQSRDVTVSWVAE